MFTLFFEVAVKDAQVPPPAYQAPAVVAQPFCAPAWNTRRLPLSTKFVKVGCGAVEVVLVAGEVDVVELEDVTGVLAQVLAVVVTVNCCVCVVVHRPLL